MRKNTAEKQSEEKFVWEVLLRLSRLIDAISRRVGLAARWLVLVAVIVSAGNATVRYLFSTSSNAWLETQWYLFAAVFLLCSPYTLLLNEHVRIDVLTGGLSQRGAALLDILGGLFFLLPMSILIMMLSWPMFMDSYMRHELSTDAGGLIRWPVKLLIPVGFFLLSLQGVSEIIKRCAFLAGAAPFPISTHDAQTEEIKELVDSVEKGVKR